MLSSTYLPLLVRKPLLLPIFLLSFATVAFCQSAKVDSSKMITLRLNPQEARGAAVSQIFDEVNFIPLETTKESLFGSINDLKILKGHFVVFDYDTRCVLIFSKTGKFKAKINGSMISDPAEDDKDKGQFYGFDLQKFKGDSVISIRSGRHIHHFGLDGKRIEKVPLKDLNYSREFLLGSDEARVRPNFIQKRGSDSTWFELAILRKNDTLAYFPFDIDRYKKDEFWDSPKFFSYGVPDEMFFINLYDFDIYRVSPSNLSLAYRIIFPAVNTLPKDFISNPIYLKKKGEFFRSNPKVFYRTHFAYLIGDNLYLQMSCFAPPSEAKKAIIYNLKTTEMTSLQDLQPDSLSQFLPVNDAGGFYDFANRGFHLLKDDYLYTSYSSLAMFSFKSQLGDKQQPFSPLMQQYFKTQDKKSNPVIVQLKPKKN